MKTDMNVTKGLIAARIIAVTVMVVFFGLLAVEWITGNPLPDMAKRFIGIVELLALPTAVFTSVRINMIRRAQGTK